VRDKAGHGLPETRITIENEENGNRRATRTDETGNYTIFNLPPGSYKITATKDGFREQTITGFPIQFNQKNVIRLPLFTLLTGTLNGKVIDTAGNVLPGARIIVVGKSDNVTHETVANRAGFYSLPDLPFGLYTVTALWAGSRGELVGASSIFLTQQTEGTQFVGVLFPKRERGLDASSTRLPVTSREQPAVIQPAQFRRPGPVETVRAITDTRPNDRRTITTPANNRQPATAAPRPGQTATPSNFEGAGAAAMVNATDAARSSNFSERQINSLPVGGASPMRSFDEFALLAPGVAPPPYTPGVRGPGVGFGIGTAGQFSVNGMRARSNNFSVDGSDNNDPDVGVRRQGFVALVPQPIESVKEVSISTLLWDAELGRNFGSQVNAVTKYGGNKYHGQLFALFTDSRLNARNFFDTNGKPPFTRTQEGVTYSGPIIRNRTQFFVSFEHDQTKASVTQHFSTPTAAERRLRGGGTYTTFISNSNAPIPFTDALPLGREVLRLYPLPNNPNGPYGANTFTTRAPADNDGVILSLKLTHQINLSSSLSARYNFTDDGRVLPSVNQAIRSTLDSRTRSHNFSLIFDKALGHRISNQARFSFGRTLLDLFEYPGNPFIFSAKASQAETFTTTDGKKQITGLADTGPLGELLIEPFSPVGVNAATFPQRRASNTFQYADSVSWSAGNHSIKFGADIRRYQLNSVLDRLYRPQAVFGYARLQTGDSHGHVVSSTLLPGAQVATLGVPSSVLQTVTLGPPDSTIGLRFTEYHAFVNDNWRIRKNFVLDFGLRYEYNTVPHEVNNRIETALRLENIPPKGPTILDTLLLGGGIGFDITLEAYRKILDGRKIMYDPDYNNFAPRLGFAWSIDQSGRTVIRGGYGIYYDAILGAVVSQSRNVFPNEIQFNFDVSGAFANTFAHPFAFNNPASYLVFGPFFPQFPLLKQTPCNQFGTCNQFGLSSQDFTKVIGSLFSSNGLAFTLPEKKLRSPYAQQWHLTVEREVLKGYLLSIAYVGSKGTKLTRLTTPNLGPEVTANVNTGIPSTVFNVSHSSIPIRPDVLLGPYQIFENSASSIYHAMQIEARKRYSRNYQFTAAYTWSHAIDDVSDLFPIAGAPVIAQDSFNFQAERGDANFDIRQRFVASLLWDLPFYRNSSNAAGRLFKNWQIASIFQMNTGQPFTLNLPVDANFDGNLTDRPSTTNGLTFLTAHGPQRIVLAPGKQLTDFFTFSTPLNPAFPFIDVTKSTVGRNTARGDNFIDLDLSVSRTFKFGETKNLLLRAEFFNFLNRANFGLPVRILDAPGFGSAVDTVNPGRTIVFVLKSAF
jgi:Carboxypeptidase regulatory-like domain